jgi:ATP-dependent Clp endopeptidase proteolytic subunit ClpP
MEVNEVCAKQRSTSPRGGTRRTKDSGSPNIKRIYNSIYFSDRINHDTAHTLILMLRNCELDILEDVKAAEAENKKASASRYADPVFEPKPIELYLTTHGGLVHAAFAVVDVIRALRVPVHTIVLGYVASAGTLISLAGSKRFITSNAFMMIHEIRSGFWGKASDARVEYENVTKLMAHITEYYLGKTRITRERLVEMLRVDTDLNAAECAAMGLVDSVRI